MMVQTPYDFNLLLACYRSGQISERQWQAHLSDPLFRLWLEHKRKENTK